MIAEELAPPFAAPVKFQDVEPRVLNEEERPKKPAAQPDIWDAYLQRILAAHTLEA